MINIENVLQYLELKDTMMAAEFGCGSGHFISALAKKLTKGRVYALDIQASKLSTIKGPNIIPILCDLERVNGSTLHTDTLDVVVIPNLLFQVENKDAILIEAVRILKPGGQVIIIDSAEHINSNEVKGMAASLRLKLKHEFAAGDHHYSLLFVK